MNLILFFVGILFLMYFALIIFFAIQAYIRYKSGNFVRLISADGVIDECETYDKKGKLKDGQLEGYWKIKRSDGQIQEGNFHKGKLDGEGKIMTDKGITIAQFKNGICIGKALFIDKKGNKAEGYMVDGEISGEWQINAVDGSKSIAEYSKGVLNGKKTNILHDGTKVISYYKNGKECDANNRNTIFPNGETPIVWGIKEANKILHTDNDWIHSVEFDNIKKNSILVILDKLKDPNIGYYSVNYIKGDKFPLEEVDGVREITFESGSSYKVGKMGINLNDLESNTTYSCFIIAKDIHKNIINVSNEYQFKTL